MPRDISGLRIARSHVTPAGSATVSRELDFQLGPLVGLKIWAVLGTAVIDISTAPAAQTMIQGQQTLHLETGTLEDVPNVAGEDEDNVDSEIFYRQEAQVIQNDDLATEFRASAALLVTPSNIVNFAVPIFAARNISHRGESIGANADIIFNVMIYFNFVQFSLSEMGLLLVRRT